MGSNQKLDSQKCFLHGTNKKNEKLELVLISEHSQWIAISCTEMDVPLIIGLCASFFFLN